MLVGVSIISRRVDVGVDGFVNFWADDAEVFEAAEITAFHSREGDVEKLGFCGGGFGPVRDVGAAEAAKDLLRMCCGGFVVSLCISHVCSHVANRLAGAMGWSCHLRGW